MKRRVLHVIPTLERTGAAKQLTLLTGGLSPNDFDVHVCALARGGPFAKDLARQGIPLAIIDQHWKFNPAAYWQLRRHVSRLKPDVVHTWTFAANSYGRAAALGAGVRNIVASESCVDPWKAWHHLAIDRHLTKRTAKIVVNGRGVQEFYVGQGLPAEKFRLIPSGVGPAAASTVSREQLLAELNLPPGAKLMGAVGRLCLQKRIKDLIWATDLLKVIRDDAHLLIIGDGPQRQILERYRRLCQLEDKVHFLGKRDDVPRLMPHFNQLWLASGYEGLSNAVMEAMSCGVPVVATDISGNRELVVHDQTGYLSPVGDRANFARFAHKILENSELAARLGAAGKQRMAHEFTVGAMVERHAALYREIME